MITHGNAPYLECSTAGDRRFSVFVATLVSKDCLSIEQIYQSNKRFVIGTEGTDALGRLLDWKKAKGKKPINQVESAQLYLEL